MDVSDSVQNLPFFQHLWSAQVAVAAAAEVTFVYSQLHYQEKNPAETELLPVYIKYVYDPVCHR